MRLSEPGSQARSRRSRTSVTEKLPPASVTLPPADGVVLRKLSTLDRFLPLWIASPWPPGSGSAALIPSLNDGLDKLQVGTVSLPIALGLLLMMYPVLAKVRYEELGHEQTRRRLRTATSTASRSSSRGSSGRC